MANHCHDGFLKDMQRKTSFKEELRKSLVRHALVPFVVTIGILILVLSIFGHYYVSTESEKIGEEVASEVKRAIGAFEDETITITSILSLDSFIDDSEYRVRQLSNIYNFINSQNYRSSFYLYDKNFELIYSTENNHVLSEYIHHFLSSNSANSDFLNKPRLLFDNWHILNEDEPYCLSLRPILNNNQIIGYGGFAISSKSFVEIYHRKDVAIILTNNFRRVFSSDTYDFIDERNKLDSTLNTNGLISKDYDLFYVVNKTINGTDLNVVIINECTSFFVLLVSFIVVSSILALIMFRVVNKSAIVFASKKTKIMYELIDALKEVEKGNLDIELNIASEDEFAKICKTFNKMIKSINNLINVQNDLVKQNNIANVQALETQFNPHFLYNTLESIRYMIYLEPKVAEKMMVNLSKLLRYSIQREEKAVTLKEEISFAKKYLEIMTYRFKDRLDYEFIIDEDVYDDIVLRMFTQPIIENSIKYAYGESKYAIVIKVTAHHVNDNLEVIIEDDGVGIDEELLNILIDNFKNNINNINHIGLHNVQRRIRLIYGEPYGLRIESIKDKGTKIYITLPIIKERD